MMDALKLFKLLQKHVATLNETAAGLYADRITPDEAYRKAKETIEATLSALKEG